MNTEKRLCPYMKTTLNIYNGSYPTRLDTIKEEFLFCKEDECMAYKNFGMYGKCKLIETV